MLEYKLCEMFGGVTILAENKSSLSVSEEQFSGNGSIVGRFRGGLLPTMNNDLRNSPTLLQAPLVSHQQSQRSRLQALV